MTYAELFNNEYWISFFFGFLSFISSSITMLNIIFVSICFLGCEAKVTKKTLIFPLITIVVGLVSYGYSGIKVLYNLKNHGDTLIPVNTIDDAISDDVALYAQIAIIVFTYILMFFTAFVTFKKHKILRGIEAIIALYAIEEYMQILIVSSISYISGDFEKVYGEYTSLIVDSFIMNIYNGLNFVFQLSFLLILYFVFYKKLRFIYVGWGYRILFILWVAFNLFSIFYISYDSGALVVSIGRLETVHGVTLLITSIGLPVLVAILIARKRAVEKTKIQEEYIESELEYINQYKRSQEETRAFRHDIANNLSLLAAMMEEGKSDEAKDYVNELRGELRGMSPKYATGDEMLDCIVGMKASKMEEDGIKFNYDGLIDGGLGMKPVDVCNIFANALDNAIEACERISDKDNRWIDLKIKKTDQFFNIKLSNSIIQDKKSVSLDNLFDGSSRKTSKKDKNLHGFGTQNMKRAIEKYDGMLKSEAEEDTFTLSIMIPR